MIELKLLGLSDKISNLMKQSQGNNNFLKTKFEGSKGELQVPFKTQKLLRTTSKNLILKLLSKFLNG